MYRPAIGMMICLMSALGTSRASESRTRLTQTPVTAPTIIPDGNNLEQTENWVLRLWHNGNDQGAHGYIASISNRGHDPDSCKNQLEALIQQPGSRIFIQQGNTLLAIRESNARSIKVYDEKFEELNPCKHNARPGLQTDNIVTQAARIFTLSRSGTSPNNQAVNDLIKSVAGKAPSPELCQGELKMFADLGKNPKASLKLSDGQPIGITAIQEDGTLQAIDLREYAKFTSCVVLAP